MPLSHMNLRYGLAGTLVVVVLQMLALVSVISLWSPHPIRSFEATPDKFFVHRGDVVLTETRVFRWKGGCSSRIFKSWRDADNVEQGFKTIDAPSRPAGWETPHHVSRDIVPTTMQLGPAVLQTRVQFFCNPFQKAAEWGSELVVPDKRFFVLSSE